MTRILPILALGIAIMSTAACSHQSSALNAPPGKYESSTSTTNPGGTDVSKKADTTVGYDANGDKQAVTQTKTTVDPPGLFNKSTSTSTTVEK